MALRREIELLRKRWAAAFRSRGLLVFSGALIVLIGAIIGLAFLVLRPQPPIVQSEAPIFCRPCAALSRLERSMTLAMSHEENISVPLAKQDRGRIIEEIAGWRRRCSTLLCSQPADQDQACKAPAASLLTELASVDALAESLSQRTSTCAEGGCESARCEQASTATSAFSNLHQDLQDLIAHPSALVGDRHQIATSFVFDQLGTLDDAVLAAPGFVADDRFAAAEGRLLFLRDAAVQSEASTPDSAEGLLADRLDEVNAAIEGLAQGRRAEVGGDELASLWRDFADASARLLVEAATLRAEMHSRAGLIEALAHPQAMSVASGQDTVCTGAVQLVRATEDRVAQAMGQLNLCNLRADCASDEEPGVTSVTGALPRSSPGGGTILEQLASAREAAAAALRPLAFQKDAEVTLTTDLKQYFSGEAISVRPLIQNNRCLSDRNSRLALTRLSPDETVGAVVESHTLDPADSAALLFAAPDDPGTYQFVLETSKSRGAGRFGASATFSVTPTTAGACSGFNGRWQTDFGVLTVFTRDGIARGSYRQNSNDRAGLLVGAVDGTTLTGQWTSELGNGGAKLILSPDGRTFTGTWSQYPDRTSGAGKWDGTCLGSAASPPAPVEALPGPGNQG